MSASSSRVRRGLVLAALTALLVGAGGGSALASVDGVDVARYQHPDGKAVDWSAVHAAGERFAIVKATEGVTYTNPYFAGDFADARAAGLVRGAYHYARPDTSPGDAAAEARHFVDVAGTMSGRNTMPGVLDLEDDGGLTVAQLVAWTTTWLSTVESLTGRTPIIYSYPYFWETRMGNSTAFTRYPLWIAHYTTGSPRIPGGWSRYTMWQYTSIGQISGISGDVDRNRFNGSEQDLAAFSHGVRTTLGLGVTGSGPATLSGTLTAGSGAGIAGEPIEVYSRPSDTSTWTQFAALDTQAGGAYSLQVAPATTTQYQVRYAGDSLRLPSVSATVSAGPPPVVETRLSLSAATARLTYGQSSTVRGRLTQADGSAVGGKPVTVYRRPAGRTSWSVEGTVTTRADGRYALSVQPSRNTDYAARFAGDAGHRTASTVSARILVAPAVTVRVSDATPARGSTPTLFGRVTPAHAGQTVHRQRLVGGTWRDFGTTQLSSTGTYRFTLRPRRVATYRHRVVKPADADHVRAVSGTLTVTTH